MFQIEQAEVSQAKAKIAIVGPAGSGKTYTALVTAKELGKRILVIDTENKTSAKYAKLLGPYDILPMSSYAIKTYIEALEYSAKQAYDVVIVDSLSHAWAGKGGALEQAEQAKSKYGGNKFAAWGDVTPLQNKLVDTILSYPAHLIATMRMKIEYALITGDNGRQQVSKLGLGIIQRDSFEYEFDIIAQMDVEHNLTITKTRCFEIDGFMAHKPDGTMGKMISSWLGEGQPLPPKELSYEPVIEATKAIESSKAPRDPLAIEADIMPSIDSIPNSPIQATEAANVMIGQIYYKAPQHAFNALKKELGDKWTWPKPNDAAGWKEAFEFLVYHGSIQIKAKETAGEPAEEIAF